MIDLEKILNVAKANRASDVHLSAGNPAAFRVDGTIKPLTDRILSEEDLTELLNSCLTKEQYAQFCSSGDFDCAADLYGLGRFRINAFRQIKGSSLVMRIIPADPPSFDEVNLPSQLRKILELKNGLVLITGPTGSGKSTTLAALINELNINRQLHIITIEDPIEYMHKPKNCVINQREVGKDSHSFVSAMKAALREDPDIILIGEMRDTESIAIALTAAETGHLVLSTLHTSGAAMSIDRLVDVFSPDQQSQIRTQLSMSLKIVASQKLLVSASGKGRVGAFEIMFVNSAISNLIREGKTANVNQVIQTNYAAGMLTFERSIADLVESGTIDKETGQAALFDVK